MSRPSAPSCRGRRCRGTVRVSSQVLRLREGLPRDHAGDAGGLQCRGGVGRPQCCFCGCVRQGAVVDGAHDKAAGLVCKRGCRGRGHGTEETPGPGTVRNAGREGCDSEEGMIVFPTVRDVPSPLPFSPHVLDDSPKPPVLNFKQPSKSYRRRPFGREENVWQFPACSLRTRPLTYGHLLGNCARDRVQLRSRDR